MNGINPETLTPEYFTSDDYPFVEFVRRCEERLPAIRRQRVVHVPVNHAPQAQCEPELVQRVIDFFTSLGWEVELVQLSGWAGLGPHLQFSRP